MMSHIYMNALYIEVSFSFSVAGNRLCGRLLNQGSTYILSLRDGVVRVVLVFQVSGMH